MSIVARLEERALQPDHELAALLDQAKDEGAVVNFVGVARPTSKSGDPVDQLVLDHHPRLTVQSLQDIAVSAAERFDVSHVRVVHRCGKVASGEPIVFAGAASAHRRAAFDAADYLMDRLKTDAIFWKREVGEAGSQWIEPTEGDYADRDRWG
ncbi:MAG TPA: molybdenum cofactor biosynthesis protein MoaE [Sphingomicrobium sp.]